MNADEYQRTQDHILATCLGLTKLDLPGFLLAIDRAETIGPITDPTLYRAANEKLARIKNLAIFVRDLVSAFKSAESADSVITALAIRATEVYREGTPRLTDMELSALIEACDTANMLPPSQPQPLPPWCTDGGTAHDKLMAAQAARAEDDHFGRERRL